MRKQILILCLAIQAAALAQNDKLTLSNGDYLEGEIKGMNRGVLKIETDYSDSDFAVEWEGIASITTRTFFLVSLSNGNRHSGTLTTLNDQKVEITSSEGNSILVDAQEIVFMESVNRDFWSKINASIDFGWDLTKANTLRQASLRSNIGYQAERWAINTHYNAFASNQDSVERVSRDDARIGFRYYFQKRWFGGVSTTFLSNTEQKLRLRTNAQLGAGTYLLHTNQAYWSVSLGLSYNSEHYVTSSDDRESMEGVIDTELNLFDTGDLSLRIKVTAYPGLTQSGRWRSDFNTDVKYDLPKDFYIKIGLTLNYDNQPVAGASDTDYVFATGFGWEL
ncbi:MULTISPECIES: DUF481 domain-containing protein [unclassified Carboxylicivirga]|uniref:DUF481 domain-containing protein n=1 Tax=Carboxylicivirga TaxID=1628153 RepID=UPI003D354F86